LKVSNVASIQSQESVAEETRRLQISGRRVVFTNGCFDILHPGHIDILTRARHLGDVLVVAINSDSSVRRFKGPGRPVFPESERAELLASLEMVDYVCIFEEDTPLEIILKVRPDILVKGADWGLDGIIGRSEVEGWGGQVIAIPLVEGHSTTGIVDRILSRTARS
jgi:D-beta-D-heptose 7-phosphate kinase/D-beta-D-heptose 1-phosphate adenosyltransferase